MSKNDILRGPYSWLVVLLMSAWAIGLGPSAAAADVLEETREVAAFHAVSASIPGRISLIRGAEQRLLIEALPDTLQRIITDVEDGVLRIRQKSASGWWRDSGPIRVYVSYQALDALEMSGSADVITDGLSAEHFRIAISGSSNIEVPALTADSLDVRVSGSGNLDVGELTADQVEVVVSGSGDVQLTGRAAALTVRVNGSGNVGVADLEVTRAAVAVSGSGDVSVWALDELDVQISGSGNVEYRGEPGIESRISGSGDLEPR